MADLGNQKIKNTYQFVLQADGSGNVQKLDGNTPSLIFNSPITYNVGTLADGYVLKSNGSGGASWGPVAFSGDVYISGGTIVSDTIKLKASSGGTISIPGLSFSANSDGTIGNAPRNKNVGIGTSTPNKPLTVVGDISASTKLYVADLEINSSGYVRKNNDNRIFFPIVDNSSAPNILYGFWGMQDNGHFYWGSDEDLDVYHSGTQGYIHNNTGTLNILSSALKLGDTTSEVTVQDNLVVNDDLTVNTDNLYVHSTNERVGIKTLNPDAVLTVSGDSSTGFTAYNLNGGNAEFSNGFTRVRFTNGATTNDLSPGDQIQVVDSVGDTYIVNVNTVNDAANIFLTVNFPGGSINATSFNYNGAIGVVKLFKVYDGVNPVFQVSGSTVMSGTTDLLDIFSRVGMSGTVTSVAISGSDGIDVDSGSPITDSGTIALGLSNIDATKIANGTVTNTEFQYINTLSSNAQTQLDSKLPKAGGTMTGDLSLGTNQINELAEPTLDNDAATKGYVDTQVGATDYWSATTTGGHIINSGLTGNVGIGTDTPGALLDVKGTANITQRLGVSGETAVGGAVHTNTSFVVGNATLTTSELDISSGNFTLDVEGDITLDANGADIILSDDGTNFGRFKRDTSDFVIKSETNDKDIIFKGEDGGGTITALTLDMSEAGKATFNSNVVSANEDVYMFSNRGQGQTDNTHWYGPNYQGIYNYSWSKDYGDDTEVLTLDEEYANAGLLVPYNCILTGFFTIGHTNSGTVGYSCGLWYVLQADLASSLNVTSGTAGDVTLSVGVSGTTVNPGNGKNPLTIDKRGTVSIALTAGSMIYPRVGDSAVVTDTTWNIYLKRT